MEYTKFSRSLDRRRVRRNPGERAVDQKRISVPLKDKIVSALERIFRGTLKATFLRRYGVPYRVCDDERPGKLSMQPFFCVVNLWHEKVIENAVLRPGGRRGDEDRETQS